MMKRKDCDKARWRGLRRRGGAKATAIVVSVCACLLGNVRAADAGAVRVWSKAVVVTDRIRLDDVCVLNGFTAAVETTLKDVDLGDAPSPGELLIIEQKTIREAVRGAGVNMATVTVSGAGRCEVTRPSAPSVTPPENSDTTHHTEAGSAATTPATVSPPRTSGATERTLRQAVIDFFDDELERYNGRAEITFDRASEQMLGLSEPTYTFRVRRRGGPPLGLVPVEVDVLTDGAVAQRVPFVVSVSMVRRVVVAHRPINQGAIVNAGDVETMELRFNHIDKIGLSASTRLIGQRAKRFITAGSMIDLTCVESVPLVVRGQLVTLESVAGGVKVVTTAKAAEDGLLGQTITVRATDNRRVEFDALVVGVGRVRIGRLPVGSDTVNLVEAGS